MDYDELEKMFDDTFNKNGFEIDYEGTRYIIPDKKNYEIMNLIIKNHYSSIRLLENALNKYAVKIDKNNVQYINLVRKG
jgi:hypothetical protein